MGVVGYLPQAKPSNTDHAGSEAKQGTRRGLACTSYRSKRSQHSPQCQTCQGKPRRPSSLSQFKRAKTSKQFLCLYLPGNSFAALIAFNHLLHSPSMPSARALHRWRGHVGVDSRQRIAMTGVWESALSAIPLIDGGASLRVGRGLERGGNFRRGSSNHHFILSSSIYTIPPMHELRSRSTRALPCVNCHAVGEWEADAQRLTRPP